MEKLMVKAIKKNQYLHATFYYSTEPPWVLSIEVPKVFKFEAKADDLFEAFLLAREQADTEGIKFLCNGAREDVYPSPMSRSMSGGLVAYELTLGQQALRKNMVRIFDETQEEISSVPDQKEFYGRWLASL